MDSCVRHRRRAGDRAGDRGADGGAGVRRVVTDVDGDGARVRPRRSGPLRSAGAGRARRGRVTGSSPPRPSDHGRLTAWFNNAGVGDDGSLVSLGDEQVRRLVEVNLLGCLWGMRAALAPFGPRARRRREHRLAVGARPVPGYAVYAATKAAVVSVTMSVSAEVPTRVRVHALCPDGVQTAMLEAQDHDGARLAAGALRRPDPHRRRDRRRRRGPGRDAAGGAVAAGLARRVVRSSSLAPSVARHGTQLFAARGRRLIARRAGDNAGR